jgi:hypothetical protein
MGNQTQSAIDKQLDSFSDNEKLYGFVNVFKYFSNIKLDK